MKKNVLIVDDQKGIRFLLEEIIRHEGHDARSCADGLDAISEIEKDVPNLLIIDYQLPFKNGIAVVEYLEKNGYVIPTILMSGLNENLKIKGKPFEMIKAYFSKPFDIIEARKTINQILAN